MLSSSSYVLLKLYETTSPQKQSPSDCITRYKSPPILLANNHIKKPIPRCGDEVGQSIWTQPG